MSKRKPSSLAKNRPIEDIIMRINPLLSIVSLAIVIGMLINYLSDFRILFLQDEIHSTSMFWGINSAELYYFVSCGFVFSAAYIITYYIEIMQSLSKLLQGNTSLISLTDYIREITSWGATLIRGGLIFILLSTHYLARNAIEIGSNSNYVSKMSILLFLMNLVAIFILVEIPMLILKKVPIILKSQKIGSMSF